MSLASDRVLTPGARRHGAPVVEEYEAGLDIAVIFTTAGATSAALKRAGQLAESLGTRVLLIVPQVVPYPLALTNPPVPVDFQERRLREMAGASPVEVRVQLYLCRDPVDTLKTVLKPSSLVVVGSRKRWWPTRETGMARKLRRAGHVVIVVDAD